MDATWMHCDHAFHTSRRRSLLSASLGTFLVEQTATLRPQSRLSPLCPLRPPRSHPATRLHWPTSQPTEASKKNTIRVHLGQLPRGRDTMNEAGMGRCQQILFKDTDLDAGAGWKICRDTVHTPPNRRRSPRTSPVPFSASACLLRHPLPASPSPFFPPLCRSVALQMSSLPCRPLNCQGCSLCPDASPHIFP